jgi:hypothetical protein
MMHTIKIFVRGGVVYEVDNLPDGFDYEIIDHDTKESATDWLDENYLKNFPHKEEEKKRL